MGRPVNYVLTAWHRYMEIRVDLGKDHARTLCMVHSDIVQGGYFTSGGRVWSVAAGGSSSAPE